MNPKLIQLLLVALMIPSLAHCEKQPALNTLDQLKWKNRILLIHHQQDTSQLLKQINAAKAKIDDRHMVWIIIGKNGMRSNYRYEVPDRLVDKIKTDYFTKNATVAVLIGKDGFVKSKYQQLDLEKVFKLIDTMPMRQSEMNSQDE